MKKLLTDWFTEPDNLTWCLFKAATAIGLLVFLGCAIYAVVFGKPFDYEAFGIGYGSMVALTGGGLYLKKDTPK
jgi:hypothetical protein